MKICRGLSLMSGGLDSQLAVKVLQNAGAYVEGVFFVSPFFKDDGTALKAAQALEIKIHKIDFTDTIVRLLKSPPHGFGSAMNPCIDCHAAMIACAGELMNKLEYDFVATGEVVGQRPFSQNKQALGVVEKNSGLSGRLLRPLSAKLLPATIPELENLIEREKLYDISGRSRERQIAMAREFGITEYPSPAGGCRLTEESFAVRLRDLMNHEGLGDRYLLDILTLGRRFRLPGGSSVILGRNQEENVKLRSLSQLNKDIVILTPIGKLGATALIPSVMSDADFDIAKEIVESYAKGSTEEQRAPYKKFQII
jgi:tRNA U34 2-thiouridine synthase MnmA/TrmU